LIFIWPREQTTLSVRQRSTLSPLASLAGDLVFNQGIGGIRYRGSQHIRVDITIRGWRLHI
jgi:hypothetical protein